MMTTRRRKRRLVRNAPLVDPTSSPKQKKSHRRPQMNWNLVLVLGGLLAFFGLMGFGSARQHFKEKKLKQKRKNATIRDLVAK
jgi:hypothetical protein